MPKQEQLEDNISKSLGCLTEKSQIKQFNDFFIFIFKKNVT
jgi:hypothetical protein